MNELQSQKRNSAFILFVVTAVVFLGLLLVLPLLPPTIKPPKQVFMLLVFPSVFVPQIFWYKGFYHWSKSKGYHGTLALIGLLGFPFAPLIMVLLKDRIPAIPPSETP